MSDSRKLQDIYIPKLPPLSLLCQTLSENPPFCSETLKVSSECLMAGTARGTPIIPNLSYDGDCPPITLALWTFQWEEKAAMRLPHSPLRASPRRLAEEMSHQIVAVWRAAPAEGTAWLDRRAFNVRLSGRTTMEALDVRVGAFLDQRRTNATYRQTRPEYGVRTAPAQDSQMNE